MSLRTMFRCRQRFLNMITLGLNLIVSYHIPEVGKMVLFAQLHPRISITAIAFFSNRIKLGCICAVLFIRRFILSNDLLRLLEGFRVLDDIVCFVINNNVQFLLLIC